MWENLFYIFVMFSNFSTWFNRKNIKKVWNKSFVEAMRFFFKRERLIIVDCCKYCCNVEIENENFNQIFDTYFCTIISNSYIFYIIYNKKYLTWSG